MKTTSNVRTLAATLITIGSLAGGANGAIIASFTGGVNPISSPDFYTNLSSLPPGSASSPQTVDDFVFTQVNGDGGNEIWTAYDAGGQTGGAGWYPNGGDFGYTTIAHTSGYKFSEFAAFVAAAGPAQTFLAYEVVNDGGVISSGVLGGLGNPYRWLSISADSGEQFDTIRFRNANNGGITVTDGSQNALAIDQVAVAVAVPEPSSTALLGLGGLALMLRRRR